MGYIDEVIKPIFNEAWDFGEYNLAVVKIDQKFGYIDNNGKIIIEPNLMVLIVLPKID